jgi:hypothetical protein
MMPRTSLAEVYIEGPFQPRRSSVVSGQVSRPLIAWF